MAATPPIQPLRQVIAELEGAGLKCALGGSGLLASLGLAEEVRDWDLTTDAPLVRVRERLEHHGPELFGPGGIHADHKLVLRNGEIEVIVAFAMRSRDQVVHLPTIVSGRWNDVPIGSPEVWAAAYTMLEREAKANALFTWLANHGADSDAIASLAAESLDPELRRRLTDLPSRATSRSRRTEA